MSDSQKPLLTIGRAEMLDLPDLNAEAIPARIDTGAKTSALWVSDIQEDAGTLSFVLFGKESKYFTGERITLNDYDERVVASSNGAMECRYTVKLLAVLHGRRIRATFTLADRSTQVYPILVGRNVLSGKFVVDVAIGTPLLREETRRTRELQSEFKKEDEA